jgi:hypothetical protein
LYSCDIGRIKAKIGKAVSMQSSIFAEKKMYKEPQSEVVLFSVEQQVLADSILQDAGSLPDAVEGDTGTWGDWL